MRKYLLIALFFTALVTGIAAQTNGREIMELKRFINTIEAITKEFKGIHTACGLSNISYGLPGRKHLNRAFMIQAILKGLDGAIVNPLDKGMISAIIAAEALAGKDDYCMNYLKAFRADLFE